MSFEGFKPQRDLGVIGEKEGSGGDIENNKFSEEIINFIGKHNEHTDKIDKDFGHEWNLANLSYEDVYYFGCNRGKFDKVTQTFSDDGEYIESFYNTLVQLNPILKNVKIKNKTDMVNVIRGIGSGLHVNDIKFFTEDLEGKGWMNSDKYKEVDMLNEQAKKAYLRRNGITEEIEQNYSKEESRKISELLGKSTYILSPETARRMIENDPYKKDE